MTPPNLILIVVDSLRYDVTVPHPRRPALTPALAELSGRAHHFTQAIAQGNGTRTSMSALMSGVYSSQYGGPKRLSPARPAIQSLLQSAGYTTLAASANPFLSPEYGWERGFDRFDPCQPVDAYHRSLPLRLANQLTRRLGRPVSWPAALPADQVFARALALLRHARQPYFLWVHLMDPHFPYVVQGFSWHPALPALRQAHQAVRNRYLVNPAQVTPGEIAGLWQYYTQSIAYLDAHLSAFLRRLGQAGQLDATWLFITADHGELFGEHALLGHSLPASYEPLVRVPLVIVPPARQEFAPRRHTSAVRLVDLVPTWLELAGAAVPPVPFAGESLLPVLTGVAPALDRPTIIESSPDTPSLAIRMDGWKLLWDLTTGDRQLFDLRCDPSELDNCLDQHPDVANRLQTALAQHRVQTGYGHSTDSSVDEIVSQRLRDLGYL